MSLVRQGNTRGERMRLNASTVPLDDKAYKEAHRVIHVMRESMRAPVVLVCLANRVNIVRVVISLETSAEIAKWDFIRTKQANLSACHAYLENFKILKEA